ncbi:DUF2341 domain-containing protein [Nocardioides sp. Bht2]|uniref:DUF2341 domain-containing protein n=1 Tax=Nocardioides sp. Bht2 TaxID=3392297 RepID=UPI0039B37AB7
MFTHLAPPRLLRRARALTLLLSAALIGLVGFVPFADSASAATLPGLEGDGTPAQPLLIDTAEDLDAVVTAVNTDAVAYGSLSYRLAADLDYGGRTFAGFTTFGGTFDGDGHSISNMVYSNAANSVAFFQTLDGAQVRGLTLRNVSGVTATGDGAAGLIARMATNSVISQNTILDSSVRLGPGGVVNTQAGGVVGSATGSSVISDNLLWNVAVTGHKYAAGVAAYPRSGAVKIERNLLVDVTVLSDAGGSGATAGLLISQGGAGIDVAGNVVLRGGVSKSGSGTSAVGPEAMTGTRDNLVSTATTIKAGSVPGAPATRGTLSPADEPALPDLTGQPTYAGLGWDFADVWRWEPQISQAAPRLAALPPLKQAGIPGAGTSTDPYLIDSATDLDVLTGALNSDAASYARASVALTADIDYDGDFVGIDTFAGDLNGAGHTISGLRLVPSTHSADLGLIRELTGRVRNLNLVEVTAQPTAATERVAAVAVSAEGTEERSSEISLVQVSATALTAADAEVVGGLVAEARGDVVLRENVVDLAVTAQHRAGGLVGDLSDGAKVRQNLVTARVAVHDDAGAAGLVVAAPTGAETTVRGNVVVAGEVEHPDAAAGRAGRIVGDVGGAGAWVAEQNLANSAITVAGAPVDGPGTRGQHGTDTTDQGLAVKSTYVELGWNFVDTWLWDATARTPKIKYVLVEDLPNRITNTFYGDPSTQRAFTWYQDYAAEEPAVLLSTDPTFPDDASTVLAATQELSEDGETIFRVVANELTPGTSYRYRVGDNHTGIWSEIGTFVTPSGEGDFSFIDLADTQARGGSSEAAVSAATMAKALTAVPDAEFMVHNGDVVQTGDVESDWTDLFGAAQESLLATTIAPVSGNHDLHKNRFIDHFTLEQPNDQDASTGAYYSYDYNGAHFMMLNTNEGEDRDATDMSDTDFTAISDAQLAWLRADALAARERGADWLILTTHKGPYTAGAHPTDADIISMRERLVPLIDELDIDLVFQGHDHYWSRSQVLQYDASGAANAVAKPVDVIRESIGGINIEYNVEPDGTLYVTPGTAGAKHYGQLTDAAGAFDLEAYLDLFDRLGGGTRWGNAGESFLGVEVTDSRLTVNRYEIANRGKPLFAEGFGIDRQVGPVDAQLAALPDAASITLDDEPAIRDARRAVKALSKAQRQYLKNLDRLRAAEEAIGVLHNTLSADGSEVAWADARATSRMPITVRNAQRRTLADVPVRLTIEQTPDVDASTLAITTPRSVPLSFEVETWQPGGTSVVWVKLPELAKSSNQTVWAYFGGGGAVENDPTDVWSADFELVEHFGATTRSGETRRDATGKRTGTLVGADLSGRTSTGDGLAGAQVMKFDGSRLQYGGDLGGFARNFTVSGIYSLTADDLAAFTAPETGLFGKQQPGAEKPTMRLSASKTDGAARTTLPFGGANSAFAVDGKPHVVTMTFDGMTYAVFIDGEIVSAAMGEGRRMESERDVLTTIGDVSVSATDPNALVAPFRGTVDELWVASNEFIPEYDAFRAANYFGDAVSYGEMVERANDTLTLALGAPGDGAEVEAGLVELFGSLSRRSRVVATVGGEEVFAEQVDAGTFALPIPVNVTGTDVVVELTASAVADPTRTATASLRLKVTDTKAPADPVVSDERPANGPLTLRVEPKSVDAERVEARFFTHPTTALNDTNLVVRTGSTKDRVPDALTPQSGKVSSSSLATTVGEDENPFQIYTISLTPEQVAEGEYHFSWRGTGDDRTVSIWLWDTQAGRWTMAEAKADAQRGQLNLDVRATAADHAVDQDGTMNVLVWRGLTELPWGEDRDYDNTMPSPDDYDWSFNHVGDTQLYTEATPWTMTEQFEYIRDHADERKTAFVLQAGDWVNREEFEDEWQWQDAEPSARILEEHDIPFMISWGNHDYNEGRNGRQMMPKYFPMERFAASLEGSPWTFGGSHDVDNYYYTGEQDGAKILWLEVGYWSANSDDDPGLAWAKQVIEQHPDYTVILGTHDYLVANGGGDYSNPRINTLLVDPYPNVKLVLAGHNSGTFVSTRTNGGGSRTYGILTDYQTRAWGGHGFLKNLSVDAENGLIHVNTYSPWLQSSTSDGRWNYEMDEAATPGFHGDNAENYVIELDLGGVQTRTLAADRITFSVGAPTQLGEPQSLRGDQAGTVEFSPELGVQQEWYAVLTDPSGNSVTSRTRTVRRMTAHTISYDLAGGSVAGENPEAYTADDEPITLVNPTRAGYEFTGWTGTGISRPATEVTIATGSTGDRDYTATWERIDYRVSYDLDGGLLETSNPRSYHVESESFTLANPTRGGYEFLGWVGHELTEPTRSVTVPTGSVGDRSYTAVWTTKAADAVATSVTLGPISPGTHGRSSTVRVTVTDAQGGAGRGEVAISGIGTLLTASLADGSVTVKLPSKLAAGRHLFAVTFTGNATQRSSSSTGVVRVAKAAGPTVRLRVVTTAGAKKLRKPTHARLTVKLRAGTATPTGTVRIVARGTVKQRVLGKVRLRTVTRTRLVRIVPGQRTVRLPKGMDAGRWTVRATYLGDRNFASSGSGTERFRITGR